MKIAGHCFYCRRTMTPPGSKSVVERTADHLMPAWIRYEKLYKATRPARRPPRNMIPLILSATFSKTWRTPRRARRTGLAITFGRDQPRAGRHPCVDAAPGSSRRRRLGRVGLAPPSTSRQQAPTAVPVSLPHKGAQRGCVECWGGCLIELYGQRK
jgi:hypothetical protein